MGIARFLTTPCTIDTPSTDPGDVTIDEDGIPTIAAASVDTVCHMQPYTGREGEQVLGAEEADRAQRIWLPAGTVLRYTSTVTVGEDRYRVHGDPDRWTVGSANDHIDAVVIRVLRPGEGEP